MLMNNENLHNIMTLLTKIYDWGNIHNKILFLDI